MSGITNRLGRTREDEADHWVFRFANGLVVHTDAFMKRGGDRILALGGPQDTILNHLVCFPEKVRAKRVFDPFAGSGVFGLMALQLGAAHVDFLDVNPRAAEFQRANAERNGFAPERYDTLLQSIEDFEPRAAYDVVLANPPFVPTPPGIAGTLTSAAGPEGNDLVELLLRKLDRLLLPEGEAFIYVMQLATDAGPLVTKALLEHVPGRTTELSPTQTEAIPFDDYCDAYRKLFADYDAEIGRWRADLTLRHGRLGVQHYVMHVGPRRAGPAHWVIRDDLPDRYGIAPYPAEQNGQLALGRVLENVVPTS